jgi:hypothetical protein
MIYAIPLLVSCAISACFCYFSTSVYPSLRSQACRIACVASPFAIAALLLGFHDVLLDPLGEVMPGSPLFVFMGGETGELIIALAVMETAFSLLVTALVSEFSKPRKRGTHES